LFAGELKDRYLCEQPTFIMQEKIESIQT